MALQKQGATIPLIGLDTNADPKSSPPGTLTLAENVVYKRRSGGGVEARKRFGYTPRSASIVTGGSVAAGRKLAQLGDEQLLLNTTSLFSWDPQAGKWGNVVSAGAVPICTLDTQPVSATSNSVVDGLDVAVGGGYICTVYGQGANKSARVTVQNIATGVHVLDSALTFSVTTGILEIRVVALSTVFMIVANFTASNALLSKTIAYATPATISAEVSVSATIQTGGVNGAIWDMQRAGSNDWAMIALRTTTPNVTVIRWNSNQTSGGSGTQAITCSNGVGWLTWDHSDGFGYLATLDNAAGLRTLVATDTTAALAAAAVVDAALTGPQRNVTGYRVGTSNSIFYEDTTAGQFALKFIGRSTGGGAGAVYQRSIGVSGKPFLKNGHYILPCNFHNAESASAPASGVLIDQRTFFFLDVTTTTAFSGVVVAKAFFGDGGGQLYTSSRAPVASVDLDSNRVITIARRRAADAVLLGSTAGDNISRSAWHVIMDFSLPSSSPLAVGGSALYVPGASTKSYDGSSLCEAGFHVLPETPTVTIAAGGYGTGVAGLVGTIICWRYTDNKGQVHRSAPSQAVFGTTTAANGITVVTAQTYRLSERAANVVVEVYFTTVNGSVFYLAAQTVNDNTVDTVTISGFAAVGVTPTLVVQQPQLYTTDGTLAHVPYPPARLMCAWGGRLFLAGVEDNCDIWVSDERITGEGTSFSDANVVSMEREGGAITAIAELDNRLIIFKRSALYELTGGGPAPSGEGGFGQPSRITATVGTVIPESVVKTPQGLMFQSLRGFYILPVGGGQPVRLHGVETFESLTVTGAALLESVEQVRFMSSAGTTLVYHYGLPDDAGVGRWTNHPNLIAVDCAVFGGTFCFLTSAGILNAENTAWNDNGAAIAVQVQFNWLNLAGLFGDVRLWRLYPLVDVVTGFTITLALEVDFTTGAVQSPTFVVAATGSPALELRPGRQDAFAYRLTISETSTTQGFQLSGLQLELGAEGQLKPVATTQRFT